MYFVYNSFQHNYEEYKPVIYLLITAEWSIIMTSKQRTELKAQAMKLDSIFQIGKSSLTPGAIEAIRAALKARELIKINVGAALSELDDAPEPYTVRGPNIMTAHPVEVAVTYQEIAHCLDKSLAKIEASVLSVLEQTPPELYSDIVQRGIFLTGGGALLRGLDKRLFEKINIPFHVAEDPLRAVARGTSIALKNAGNLPFLMR